MMNSTAARRGPLEMVDEEQDARYQFMQLPKWLVYSGAWQAFGRRRTLADVYRALIMMDHSTDGLDTRRHGDDKRTFACANDDIARMVGCDYRTVGRAARDLHEIGLLEVYKPGVLRAWSHFRIERGRIVTLYRHVAPRLRKIHGGIQDREIANPDDKALSDTRIYGVENGSKPEPVIIGSMEMLKLWQTRPEQPEWPDPEAVAKILGL